MDAAAIRRVMLGAAAAALVGTAVPVTAQAQTTDTAAGAQTAQVDTDDDDDDDGPDLGWIGLLGLAGLAGLRRREPTVVHRETVQTEPRR